MQTKSWKHKTPIPGSLISFGRRRERNFVYFQFLCFVFSPVHQRVVNCFEHKQQYQNVEQVTNTFNLKKKKTFNIFERGTAQKPFDDESLSIWQKLEEKKLVLVSWLDCLLFVSQGKAKNCRMIFISTRRSEKISRNYLHQKDTHTQTNTHTPIQKQLSSCFLQEINEEIVLKLYWLFM